MFPTFSIYDTLQGVADRRAPYLLPIDGKFVPYNFPMPLWTNQAARYIEYWRWFDGTYLNESKGHTKRGEEIKKYPLSINPIRNFARKHASVLLGEDIFSNPNALIQTKSRPYGSLDGSDSEFKAEDKKLALVFDNIMEAVWSDSNGRASQYENAVLSQFLGGSVWEATWRPDLKKDQRIPIRLENIIPDFFLPIWSSSDPWDLLEAFIIYRIPNYVAHEQYKFDGPEGMGYVTYCKHYTRDFYSITLNGEPLVSNYYGPTVKYDHVPNPYGKVPCVYIPHLREGNFFGSSHVEDLRGLTRELNARTADYGDAIRDTVHRRRYVRDLQGDAKPKQLDNGVWAIDLGKTNANTRAAPHTWTEEPANLSQGLTQFGSDVWEFAMREGHIGDIAFGEDEGSQRSALTLAFRMWPLTSHISQERSFWQSGLNQLAKIVARMCYVHQNAIKDLGYKIPSDYQRRIQFTQEFKPMIPRDREQLVNETILRFQAGLLDPELALTMLGDVPYIKDEVDKIQEWLKFQASLASPPPEVKTQGDKGAKQHLTTPIAVDGTGLND